ncbi:MAG: DNA-3-methyladenine glycosylase family protein [Mycetocola sp.]
MSAQHPTPDSVTTGTCPLDGSRGDAPMGSGERQLRLPVTAPLSLGSVLAPLRRGIGDPSYRRDDGGRIWIARQEPSGVATLAFQQRTDHVLVRAWGPGADEACAAAARLLGEGDDWSSLDLSQVPVLAEVRRRHPGLRLSASGQVFAMLVPSVLEQKVTTQQAWFAWRWLLRRHGTPAPGPTPPGMMAAPTAAQWAAIPSWDWHRAGVDESRSLTVRRLADRASALARLDAASPEEAAERLMSIRGVGQWTVAEALARSHGAPDVVSVGDFHLCRTVGTAFVGEPVDDARMLELLEPWAGQRQRILRLITAAGIRAERHGPRLGVPDHVRS